MMRIIKHIEARYEVQHVGFGEIHRRHPEHLVVDCECDERPTLTAYVSVCDGCGKDYVTVLRGEFGLR